MKKTIIILLVIIAGALVVGAALIRSTRFGKGASPQAGVS